MILSIEKVNTNPWLMILFSNLFLNAASRVRAVIPTISNARRVYGNSRKIG